MHFQESNGKKAALFDFKHGKVVGARWTDVKISKNADLVFPGKLVTF